MSYKGKNKIIIFVRFTNTIMKLKKMIALTGIAAALISCSEKAAEKEEFKYLVDEFADLKIMRYQVPG